MHTRRRAGRGDVSKVLSYLNSAVAAISVLCTIESRAAQLNPKMKTFGVVWLQLIFVGIVAAQASATTPFFSFEKRVVSNTTLASTGPQYHSYFTFANSTSSVQPPLNGSCKIFPGDAAWPSPDVWGALDHVLEQSLIKTVPLAHDCYNTAWGGYKADRCAYIASNWNISYLQ